MVDSPITDLLVREARELMQAGGFGLYEFIWILNREHADMPHEAKITVARAALKRLVEEGGARIVLYDWPPDDELGELNLADVDDSRFRSPDELTPYAALAPFHD